MTDRLFNMSRVICSILFLLFSFYILYVFGSQQNENFQTTWQEVQLERQEEARVLRKSIWKEAVARGHGHYELAKEGGVMFVWNATQSVDVGGEGS